MKSSSRKSTKKQKRLQRTRKSKTQKHKLWKFFEQLEGSVPERDKIAKFSEEIGLTENQVYKWFWDTNKKLVEDKALAEQIGRKEPQTHNSAAANPSNSKSTKVHGVDG